MAQLTTTKFFPAFLLASSVFSTAIADTPLGWISSSNTSAYTTTKGQIEIAMRGIAVNDTIDVLNYRDELVANNRALGGDSGDLSGGLLEIHYGALEYLEVFYRRQEQQLQIDLGTINSASITDIDESLDTTQESLGLKWTFFESNLLSPGNRGTKASLEVTAFQNSSDDFDVAIDEIRLNNQSVTLTPAQTFSIADLNDEGWKARLIYTTPINDRGAVSFWGGYGRSDSTSATTSTIPSATIKQFFEQEFEVEESYLYLGASLSFSLTPRLPVSVNYEYIQVDDAKFSRFPLAPPAQLPGFLASDGPADEDANHTLNANMAYWLTPHLNINLSANLYTNQFIGIIPHFNNPLSGSFSSAPYGYIGLGIGLNF